MARQEEKNGAGRACQRRRSWGSVEVIHGVSASKLTAVGPSRGVGSRGRRARPRSSGRARLAVGRLRQAQL